MKRGLWRGVLYAMPMAFLLWVAIMVALVLFAVWTQEVVDDEDFFRESKGANIPVFLG